MTHSESSNDLSLDQRQGLPDALQVLLRDYPRDAWEADPAFGGLVRFWLERHQMFRRLMTAMQSETDALLDRSADPQRFAARLSRYGSHFINDLHGHHMIEDQHYFPLLAQKDARIIKGFDLLDADHHALDGILSGFAEAANAALGVWEGDRALLQDRAGDLQSTLAGLQRMISRHLDDEEDLIVPVILKYGESGLG
ncbi:hemerythrin domain-containing protein [Loktanella sp. IMCC34160]|uniref:hemerythrin domain-containing protein n=1 Tax=Loktanella sp. IMCC34160 TaxID=2510646 RepID=UPI00101D56B1|nr:hemerythrin domain-containing protein [Loktanella sp. IMCC34160]RYG89520.1 hemerythrin domain-containing protein [Loktanella sp. IMCC34160]